METYQRARLRTVLGMRRSTFLFSFYVVFYIGYLITGGFVFAALEAPFERAIRETVAEKRFQFLHEHTCVSDAELESLILVILKASDQGVSAANNVTGDVNWSFGQSLFFAGTVVTTIGYGHVTPLSKAGKIFCILYALLGIPLTLVLLTTTVERLMIPSTSFLHFLNRRLGRLCQPLNIRLFHFGIIFLILVTLFIFVPALVFTHIEPDWDYLDSLYYCFISLTTVGLGDYIPGDAQDQKHRPLYKILITGYLIIGLVFVMLTLTIFYDIPQLNVGMLFLMQADEKTKDPEKVHLTMDKRAEKHFGSTYCRNNNPICDDVNNSSRCSSNEIKLYL